MNTPKNTRLNQPLGYSQRSMGLTLLELIVVIAVIGILTAVLIVGVSGSRERANTAKSISNLRQLGVAFMAYSAERGFYPAGNETLNEGPFPLWEILRPYTGGGERHTRIAIWECPRRAITEHPNGPTWITPSYSANRFVFVDARTPAAGGPLEEKSRTLVNTIQRPSEIIALIDAGQRSPSGWSNAMLIGGIFNLAGGDFGQRNNPVMGEPITSPDDDFRIGVRYRHNGRANAVFLDGRVGSFEKGEILEKNIFINY